MVFVRFSFLLEHFVWDILPKLEQISQNLAPKQSLLLLYRPAREHVTGEEKAHGPTGTRTQDLSHTVRALWPLSYRATRSIFDNFPLLRFVPESARNHAGTDETVPLLLAARARTHTGHQMSQGRKKAHGPTGTRTQDLSHTVRAFWPLTTEPHGRPVTISPCFSLW